MSQRDDEILLELLGPAPVLPILTLERVEHAVPVAAALAAGGLASIEITLRTSAAYDAIAAIRAALPQVRVGAGTVLDASQMDAAAAAGAQFALSPGSTPAVMAAARRAGLPYLPAVATASEILQGLEHGFSLFKFFPAEAGGGAAALRAFVGPLPMARFCATGGINPSNAGNYLKLPNVLCVGASWLTPAALVEAGDWAAITALARTAAGLRG